MRSVGGPQSSPISVALNTRALFRFEHSVLRMMRLAWLKIMKVGRKLQTRFRKVSGTVAEPIEFELAVLSNNAPSYIENTKLSLTTNKADNIPSTPNPTTVRPQATSLG
jgi:hypothetical protein